MGNVFRSIRNDKGNIRKSTGFMMHHQLVVDENETPTHKDVHHIHREDGKQVGSVGTGKNRYRVVKSKDYPAWRKLQEHRKENK